MKSSLKNHFLIASPQLNDPNFEKTVTYIFEHDEQKGAMGAVINRLADIHLNQLLGYAHLEHLQRPHFDQIPIYIGGPVEPGLLLTIHSLEKEWQTSVAVSERIAASGTDEILNALAQGEGPEHFIIALGYAGWAPGQLEKEIQEDSWLFAPADEKIIFETPVDKRWQAAAQILGIDLNAYNSTSGHA